MINIIQKVMRYYFKAKIIPVNVILQPSNNNNVLADITEKNDMISFRFPGKLFRILGKDFPDFWKQESFGR